MSASVSDKVFFCRLLPPRATFPFDISEDERAVMAAHAAYWRARLGAGGAIVLGPVADPAGVWGLLAALKVMLDGDPAVQGIAGTRFEILPLMSAMVMWRRARRAAFGRTSGVASSERLQLTSIRKARNHMHFPLWAAITIVAPACQTLRNALQRDLIQVVGTVGATHVRFLYGVPFGFLFLALVFTATGTGLF
eukprot:gene31600-36171_t